jgi:cytochrome b6
MVATSWWQKRVGWQQLANFGAHKVVPQHHHAVWYYVGGMVLFLLGAQVFTGALLLFYYVPDIKSAYQSILQIQSQVDFGWFFRSLHAWGSALLILFLFLHAASTYAMKAYRPPRELTWWTGLVLLGLMLGFGFTGYLLPWDDVSFFASKIGLDITSKLPVLGEPLAIMLRGGPQIGAATLSRFFAVHVMALPLMTLPFLGLHLYLVQAHGNAAPEHYLQKPPDRQPTERFFPDFFLKDVMGWMLMGSLLAVLVTLAPRGIGPEAKPFAAAPEGIKPEWYFLAAYQWLKILPPRIGPFEGELVGIALLLFAGLGLVAMPVLDQGQSQRWARFAMIYGLTLGAGMLVFTVWGYVS